MLLQYRAHRRCIFYLHQLYFDGTDFVIDPDATSTGKVKFLGDVNLAADSRKIHLGAGSDAQIFFDGTNLCIDPDVTSTGIVDVKGPEIALDDAAAFYGCRNLNGVTASRSWEDAASGQLHEVEVTGGIITQWNVT